VLSQASSSDEDAVVRGLDELWKRRIIRELESGPQSLDGGIRGAVSSMNKSWGNDILDAPGTLPPALPSTLDQWSFPRQRRGKQPGTLTWMVPNLAGF